MEPDKPQAEPDRQITLHDLLLYISVLCFGFAMISVGMALEQPIAYLIALCLGVSVLLGSATSFFGQILLGRKGIVLGVLAGIAVYLICILLILIQLSLFPLPLSLSHLESPPTINANQSPAIAR